MEELKFLTLPGLELRLLGRPARYTAQATEAYSLHQTNINEINLKFQNKGICSSHGTSEELHEIHR
jgi:hypothetical protein